MKEDKTIFLNITSEILHDVASIIWFKTFRDNKEYKGNPKCLSLEFEDFEAFEIQKCFYHQLKNLQKYSKLISKIREIESNLDEIENVIGDKSIDNSQLKRINLLSKNLSECKYYSHKMESIMGRVTHIDFCKGKIMGRLLFKFEQNNATLNKNEEIVLKERINKMSWKVVDSSGNEWIVPSVLIKLSSQYLEEEIIDNLQNRLKSLCLNIIDSNLDLKEGQGISIQNALIDLKDGIKTIKKKSNEKEILKIESPFESKIRFHMELSDMKIIDQ